VRTFPSGDKQPKVVWQGIDDKRNPIELGKEDKSTLAHLARELGLKKAAECLKMPMMILRAWCGVYCRGLEPKSEPTRIKQAYHRKLTEPIEVPQPEPQPVSHNSLEYAPEVSKAVDKLVKSDLKVDLPPFPTFNDKWEAPVQSEWLVTYLELTKLKLG